MTPSLSWAIILYELRNCLSGRDEVSGNLEGKACLGLVGFFCLMDWRDKMLRLTLKKDFDMSELETGDLCLGYEEIEIHMNLGPFPGGGDCIIIKADGEMIYVNSNDVIHDIDAYNIEAI